MERAAETDAERAQSAYLQNLWYLIGPAASIKPGTVTGFVLFDEPILIGRTQSGEPFALKDLCPHRGVQLSKGRFENGVVECPFHGWQFQPDGACAHIPSIVSGQQVDTQKIRVRSYPIREVQGNLWIYYSNSEECKGDVPSEPFTIPQIGERKADIITPLIFETDLDNAVFGLLDPAHGAFVHKNSWWRTPANLKEKEKRFEPNELGFTMVRHPPSSNSFIYKLLGGDLTTEISFHLPGVRLEHIRAGPHHICNLTTITPMTQDRCLVHNFLYWTQGWLTAIKPVAKVMAKRFLQQDQWIIGLQNEALQYRPKTMLIHDADIQQRWYLRLKADWCAAVERGSSFNNPIEPATLRWRT